MTTCFRISRAAAVLMIAAALTACASTGGSPTPSDSTSASLPSMTPSPIDTRTNLPDESGADVTARGIDGVELGMPFTTALADSGADPVQGCEWVATAEREGYTLTIQREQEGDDTSQVVLVSASVPPDQAAAAGPMTAEGIGIGSPVADVLSAYPDAEEVGSGEMGDRRYLKTQEAEESAVFFTYTDGEDAVWAVTSTSLPMPPYEPCA